MKLLNQPLFTLEYARATNFRPAADATYLYAVTTEDRSEVALAQKVRSVGTRFVEIRETEKFVFETDIMNSERVFARRYSEVSQFVEALEGRELCLDITGLSHNAWVPIVRVALEARRKITAVYYEPHTYALNPTPRLGEIYDLSERIEGIEPLPLFATLRLSPDRQMLFVPLLGFEGSRFSYMHEQIQPDEWQTYPIIGVPGFKIEYPFSALLGNALTLERSRSFGEIKYANANCPFSLFYKLMELRSEFPDYHLKLGLTGTKPHALGAVLFSLMHPEGVELVYDHVKRKPKRTSGADRCLVYRLSDFVDDRI